MIPWRTFPRKSLLIQWAYLFEEKRDYISRTSLCSLFWRIVLLSPVKVIALTSLAIFICIVAPFVFGNALYELLMLFPRVIGTLYVLGLSLGILKGRDLYRGDHTKNFEVFIERVEDSVVVQGFIAVKSRFCPIIEID